MKASDIFVRVIAYFLFPALGTLIVYRHARDLFGNLLRGLFVYVAEIVWTYLFSGFFLKKALGFVGFVYAEGTRPYAAMAFATVVLSSYLFVLLRKSFRVQLSFERKDGADEKEN